MQLSGQPPALPQGLMLAYGVSGPLAGYARFTAGPTTVYLAVQGATTNTSTSQAPVTAPIMTPVGVVAAAMGGGALRHQTSGEHVSGTPWGRWSRPTTPSLSSGPGVVMGPVAGGHSIDHVSGGGYNGVNLSRRA